MEFRVAPNFASSCVVGFGDSAGCPVSSRPPATPSDTELGLPRLPYLRLGRRWSSESPRISHPSAVPSTDFQVAPNFGLSVSPMILPRVAPHPDLPAPADGPPEFPLGSAPSGCACGRTFESPRISGPTGLASSINFQVAPALYPSGCADRLTSRLP